MPRGRRSRRSASTRITPEIAYRRLEAHPAWLMERHRIYRDVRLPSLTEAVDLINRVAEVAERLQHHPNLSLHEWCFVRIALHSHLEGELTQQVVDLAVAIDALLEQPPGPPHVPAPITTAEHMPEAAP